MVENRPWLTYFTHASLVLGLIVISFPLYIAFVASTHEVDDLIATVQPWFGGNMIENYLTQKWKAGALQGATPKEAFFVRVGLGETMTPQDILEGRLIVEMGLAVVRPAEFIILRFSHRMAQS